MTLYRPRGALARAIFEKVHNDQYLDGYDTKLWYQVTKPLPDRFQSKFLSLQCPDEITVGWLEKAKSQSANIWLQIWHVVARLVLSFFMTQTDVNGLLKRGSMFILSEVQFGRLLTSGGFDLKHFRNNETIDILDIGAGDGQITTRLAKSVIGMGSDVYVKVLATETSWTMRERLQKQQFVVVDKIQNVCNIPLIACLNVLDRCFDPHEILQDIYDALAPKGRVLIALVLPYVHYVEYNTSHLPLKPLMSHWPDKARQYSFEDEATLFFETLEQAGFQVEAWTKAPYLCEGDLRQSFYWLVDVVVVASKRTNMTLYRPRGALARAIFEKVHNDQYLDGYDTKLWYQVTKPLPDRFQSKFLSLQCPDEITVGWLEKAKSQSANIWLQIWHVVARLVLSFFMTQTDVNGLLKRGSMFILSEVQFGRLLTSGGFDLKHFRNNETIDILDIGAGDGQITTRLAKSVIGMGSDVYVKVLATETSWTMRERLQKQQFVVVDKIQNVCNIPLIACLNVLDRCFDPHEILQDIYDALAPKGRVLIALVLPYVHYVEYNTSHLPLKPLMSHWPDKARQYSFEDEATLFFETLEQAGFQVEAWTKAPYLCEGDLRQSFYWLVDVVVVASKR